QLEPHATPAWGEAGEWRAVRRLEDHRLEHPLRPDDDVGQPENVVRERREQLRVERTRTGVPLPAQSAADDLVGARGREGRDEPVDVAPVLGDRMPDPQLLDPTLFRGVERHAEALANSCRDLAGIG